MNFKHNMNFLDNEFKKTLDLKSCEIKVELENRINLITNRLKDESIYKLNYDDLLSYERGIETMPAYYGFEWSSKCFFPFIQKMNPNTMLILELITLVYSKSIYEMISSDMQVIDEIEQEGKLLFDRTTQNNDLFFDKQTIDFLIQANQVSPLIYYVAILKELFAKQPTTKELTIFDEIDTFYITSEMYNNITNKLLVDIGERKFNEVINRMVGNYRLYFNKIMYFTDIQPMFLNIIYDCLLNFKDILNFNDKYLTKMNIKHNR